MVRKGKFFRDAITVACTVFGLFALSYVCAQAQTITISPASPTSSTPISLEISGISPVSQPVYFYNFSVMGQTVRVLGCVPPAFDTGSLYDFTVSLGLLSPGSYTIEYYYLYCGPAGQPGTPTGPLTLKTTLNLVVLPANAASLAIPTLQLPSLIVLGALIALAGAVTYRRQRSPR